MPAAKPEIRVFGLSSMEDSLTGVNYGNCSAPSYDVLAVLEQQGYQVRNWPEFRIEILDKPSVVECFTNEQYLSKLKTLIAGADVVVVVVVFRKDDESVMSTQAWMIGYAVALGFQ